MQEKYFEYDVGLSFAGEQRDYVEQVAENLKTRGLRPFYDNYEKGNLWGKDLYAYLSDIYQYTCKYCVIFSSREYAEKVWTNKERESAQARALEEKHEYILPARFDDTPIPGIADTVGYVDLTELSPHELCDLIVEKVGVQTRKEYLPPTLDRLFERLGIETDEELQEIAYDHAYSFFRTLRRMDSDEREAVIGVVQFGCPSDLPDDIHIDSDLLRRETGISEATLSRLLGGINSLGYQCTIEEHCRHIEDMPGTALGDSNFFHLNWYNLSSKPTEAERLPALQVAWMMVKVATERYCDEHGAEFLRRLDFSQLASATVSHEYDD